MHGFTSACPLLSIRALSYSTNKYAEFKLSVIRSFMNINTVTTQIHYSLRSDNDLVGRMFVGGDMFLRNELTC